MIAEGKSIVTILEEYLESEETRLPVFSSTAMKVQEEAAKEEPDLKVIEQLIVSDQSLSTQLLRSANSAFFQGLSKVTTVREAVVRLGTREVVSLVVLVSQQGQYEFEDPQLQIVAKELWRHAVACALGARWLAKRAGFQSRSQEAFLGGLLHDVGKLFMLTVMEDIRHDQKAGFAPSTALIQECLSKMHAEQGARLMKVWNLPESYSEIALKHHEEEFDHSDVLLAMVRLVNLACHHLGIGLTADPSIVLAATAEAQALRVNEILLAELEIALEEALATAG